MLISDEHRFVFVHVQKTGGITIAHLLGDAMPDLRQWPARGAKHAKLAPALADEPQLADYWITGFVRNPWARMVSWWSMIQRFKAQGEAGHEPSLARLAHSKFMTGSAAYDDFSQFVLQGSEDFDRLRTPQLAYLTAPGREADFVGRTESLATDVEAIYNHLGLPYAGEVPHVNKSPHAHHREYYTPETRDRVGELFAADVERFGYDF